MKAVLHSFAYAIDFLHRQLADVTPADMVAQPAGVVNHPVWVVGHLTLTCQQLGQAIGLSPWLPDDWPERYGSGSVPVADEARYEPRDAALAMLADARSRMVRAIERMDDRQLDQPFPDPAYLDVFPTLRHALTQVLVGHAAYHIGQIGLWRKAMGLPPMDRSFE